MAFESGSGSLCACAICASVLLHTYLSIHPVRVKENETLHAMVAGAKRNVGDDKMDYQLPIAR